MLQAILFLCEIDNVAYRLALGERIRSRVENVGRIKLSDDQAAALVWTKHFHLPAVVVFVLTAVVVAHPVAPLFGLLVFWLGGVAEAFAQTSSAVEICKRVGRASVAFSLGVLMFNGLWGLSTVI